MVSKLRPLDLTRVGWVGYAAHLRVAGGVGDQVGVHAGGSGAGAVGKLRKRHAVRLELLRQLMLDNSKGVLCRLKSQDEYTAAAWQGKVAERAGGLSRPANMKHLQHDGEVALNASGRSREEI